MECSTCAANHVEYSKVEPLQKSVFTEGSTLIFSYCSIKDLHVVTRSKRKKNFRLVVDWLVSAQHCKKNTSSCNCFRFDLQLWNSNDWSKGSYDGLTWFESSLQRWKLLSMLAWEKNMHLTTPHAPNMKRLNVVKMHRALDYPWLPFFPATPTACTHWINPHMFVSPNVLQMASLQMDTNNSFQHLRSK